MCLEIFLILNESWVEEEEPSLSELNRRTSSETFMDKAFELSVDVSRGAYVASGNIGSGVLCLEVSHMCVWRICLLEIVVRIRRLF